MSQIEATKLTQPSLIGPTAANISAPKLVMYALLEPGDGVDDSTRMAQVYGQRVARG